MLLHATAPPEAARAEVGETRAPSVDSRMPSAEPRAPKIAVSGVNFYYGLHRVLHNVSLDIQPNEVTALSGPSSPNAAVCSQNRKLMKSRAFM